MKVGARSQANKFEQVHVVGERDPQVNKFEQAYVGIVGCGHMPLPAPSLTNRQTWQKTLPSRKLSVLAATVQQVLIWQSPFQEAPYYLDILIL